MPKWPRQENGVLNTSISKPGVLSFKIRDFIPFIVTPPYLDREFLYQKYVVERLSTSEIAGLISSCPSTVSKYLKIHRIKARQGQGSKKRPGLGLAYGRRIVNREEVDHKAQLTNIRKMWTLRAQGFSYWKIADIFNSMHIPTQTGRGRWHARSIQQIMDANPNPGQSGVSEQPEESMEA